MPASPHSSVISSSSSSSSRRATATASTEELAWFFRTRHAARPDQWGSAVRDERGDQHCELKRAPTGEARRLVTCG